MKSCSLVAETAWIYHSGSSISAMALLSQPESEMPDDLRALARYLDVRLRQIHEANKVMARRLGDVAEEQDEIKNRASALLSMAEEASADEATPEDRDWVVTKKQELKRDANAAGQKMEADRRLAEHIQAMNKLYIGVARAVDAGDFSLAKARFIIEKNEKMCDWLGEIDLTLEALPEPVSPDEAPPTADTASGEQ